MDPLLGPAFGRTDFSRIFIFEPPDFFADFLAGFFLLIFVGKSAQKNPPGKSPGKSSKIYTTKILRHISADCPGQPLATRFPSLKKNRQIKQTLLQSPGSQEFSQCPLPLSTIQRFFRTKRQPKDKVFGRDTPGMSWTLSAPRSQRCSCRCECEF